MSTGAEERIKRALEKNVYGHLDVLRMKLCFKDFSGPGTVRCPQVIENFAKEIQTTLSKGVHSTLNPCIEEIFEFKSEENSGLDCFKAYVSENGEFSSETIDIRKNYVEVTLPLSILWININPFLENKKITINEGKIKTPLIHQEI